MSNENSSHHHSNSHHHSYGASSGFRRRALKRNILSNKKNRHSMKKSNKLMLIIAIIICILILLAIAAYEIYTALILPRYVKPALEDVVTVMQDETYIDGITKEIQRLYDIGEISGPEIEKYLEMHNDASDTASEDTPVETGSTESDTAVQNNSDSPKTDSANAAENGSSGGSSTVHYYSGSNKPENTVSMSELQTLSTDELYAKAKSIMSAEDFSAAMSLRSKISVSKVKQLRSTPSELVAYLRSVLTTEEYSNMLYIYAKYSNHLTN